MSHYTPPDNYQSNESDPPKTVEPAPLRLSASKIYKVYNGIRTVGIAVVEDGALHIDLDCLPLDGKLTIGL